MYIFDFLWQFEGDYEVKNGERITQKGTITLEQFLDKSTTLGTTESTSRTGKRKREEVVKSGKESKRTLVKKQKCALPKTKCPECDMMITVKGLKRHIDQQHHTEKEWKCDFCLFTTKREEGLLDHQRRIHLEPMKMGRPKKMTKNQSEAHSAWKNLVTSTRHLSIR